MFLQAKHELDKANLDAIKAESKAFWEEAKRTPQQMRDVRHATKITNNLHDFCDIILKKVHFITYKLHISKKYFEGTLILEIT